MMTLDTPFDTITAVSTPPGEGGIGIVRISGDRAVAIAKSLFVPHLRNMKTVLETTFTMNLGYIKKNGRVIDEVLVSVMKAPHTYTREDVVEINCHGGAVAVNEVLRLVLAEGARIAEPGEFTKRAFMNGRIDLSQAEAVLDIVHAKTARALEAAVEQLRGTVSQKIEWINETLKIILVELEANIDFPEEEDVSPIHYSNMEKKLKDVKKELSLLLSSYDTGKILKNGVLTVISGKPNVGKSSILNAFLKFDRAIVTEIPGTTRDVIEEQLNINGIPFIIADTAGLTKTDDVIEREGVKRSRMHMERAGLVILVFDGSLPLDEKDRDVARRVMSMPHITVINKSDLSQKLDPVGLKKLGGIDTNFIKMSALTGEGLEDLENGMVQRVVSGRVEGDNSLIITNARHFDILQKSVKELNHALLALKKRAELELIAYDVKSAMDRLGQIMGKITTSNIMNDIFQNFCIGK
jgi:tRNA modification GTPase